MTAAPIYFLLDSPERVRMVADTIKQLKVSQEHPLQVVVREPRKEKSNDQRGLWHATMDDMAKEMGHTPAEVKQIVKAEYYGTDRITLPNGRVVEVIQSSESEDRAGYSRLIDFTLRFAAENGIMLQDRRKGE